MHTRRFRCFLILAATVSMGVAGAQPPVITPLVVEGDLIPDIGNVTTIDNLAVNDAGDWLVESDTNFPNTDADGVMIRNGAVYLREDQPLPQPPGARIDSFDAVNLNNAGHSGWNFFLSGTSGTNDDSGIFFDTLLVIQEGDISNAPEFSPGTPYIGFFESKMNNANLMAVIASVDDPAIPTSVDRALVLLDLSNGPEQVTERVLVKEGDILPGATEGIQDLGTSPHQFAINDNGDVFYFADLTGNTATDGLIVLNTTIIAQEGSPSPVEGRNYETLSGRSLDFNNPGDYVFKANLDGSTADDEMIVKNGAAFIREGDTLPAIEPFVFTAFGTASGPVQIDDQGHVWWFGDWDDPDTTIDTGIFRDDELLVQEGVTMVDGMIIDEISSGQDAFQVSDNGEWFIFEVTFAGGISAALMIHMGVSDVPEQQPAMRILRAAPNPFHSGSTITFNLAEAGPASLKVYDARGRLVSTLANGLQSAGAQRVLWNGVDAGGREVSEGVYFIRLEAGGTMHQEKVVKVR